MLPKQVETVKAKACCPNTSPSFSPSKIGDGRLATASRQIPAGSQNKTMDVTIPRIVLILSQKLI